MAQEPEKVKEDRGLSALYVLADPVPSPGSSPPTVNGQRLIDVVTVHGLHSHHLKGFTHTDEKGVGTCWPRDLLPGRIPHARVMAFQYDARIWDNESGYGARESADGLLKALSIRREGVEDDRPIVLIGHSLGGIIIKKMLQLANDERLPELQNIAEATKGLIFFGTPHRGADGAKWLGMVVRILSTARNRPGSRFLPMLETDSRELFDISADFRPSAAKYAIVSFYEQHVHPILGTIIVDKTSATLGLPHENILMLGGTHSSICKFASGDPRLDTVARYILRAAKGPPVLLPSRRAQQRARR